MENQTNEVINNEQILALLVGACRVLNEDGIDYLVGGSMAFKLLTKEEISIHDIDIIVHQADFDRLVQILSEPTLKLNPIKTEYSIHANHKELVGEDGKPFDISLDSFEHYYSNSGFELSSSQELEVNGIPVKIATPKTLLKVYKTARSGGNTDKFPEYERKIKALEEL